MGPPAVGPALGDGSLRPRTVHIVQPDLSCPRSIGGSTSEGGSGATSREPNN